MPGTRWLAVLVLAPLMLLGVLATSPAQAASTADGDAQRVARVGTEGTYPPFTYVDPRTSQLTGYDIEVIKAAAKKAGWQLKFVQSQFDATFPALDANRVDAIANDNIAVLEYLTSTGSKKIKITRDAGDEISQQALTFRKSDAAMRKRADTALAS